MQSIWISTCVAMIVSLSSLHANHPYCMALLSSMTCACHYSIIPSQCPLLLLPAITHWLDDVPQCQIQSWALLQKQIHSEMTLQLAVIIMPGMAAIWVHMAMLVWSTICYQCKQAVALIRIMLVSQTRPRGSEFLHPALKSMFISSRL